VIERPRARPLRRVDEDELRAVGERVAIPEAVIVEPGGRDAAADHEAVEILREELLGTRIVGSRDGAALLRNDNWLKPERIGRSFFKQGMARGHT
jgi:hypothetical protein